MHIVFCIEHLGPRGGTEEYIRHCAAELVQRGHRVSLLYEKRSPIQDPAWDRLLPRATAAPLPASTAHRAHLLQELLRAAGGGVVFVHNLSDSSFLQDTRAVNLPIVRFIQDFRPVCLHVSRVLPATRRNCGRALGSGCLARGCFLGAAPSRRVPLRWNSLRRKLRERANAQAASRIIVASQFMRQVLLDNGFDAGRISVLPLFCSLPSPLSPAPYPNPFRLLFLGQLERYKGLHFLLAAMRDLPEDICLTVAGTGRLAAQCAHLARRWNIEHRVEFLGWMPRDKLPAVLSSGSVLVMPSVWNEPFGMVGLEAMAFGRPVIGSAVGGVSEWLAHNRTGLLVQPRSVPDLVQAIGRLYSDGQLHARLGAQAHDVVVSQFGSERHITGLLKVFEDLHTYHPGGAPACMSA